MSLLGIISDTHGRAGPTARAIDALVAKGASRIVHLGDVGDERVLDLLAGLDALVVFGNCDDERSLGRYAKFLGIDVVHPGAIIEVKTRRIGLTHGHLEREYARLLGEGVDFLLHGHTHQTRDERVGQTRVLNPGALHRANRLTALLLDPESGAAEWIQVDDETA